MVGAMELGAWVLPCAECVSSCRMCEGEKRKLVIPSELGKRSLWVCLGKGEDGFSLTDPHPIHSLQPILLQVWLVSSNEDRARFGAFS